MGVLISIADQHEANLANILQSVTQVSINNARGECANYSKFYAHINFKALLSFAMKFKCDRHNGWARQLSHVIGTLS